jgi:hypothetical protein
MRSLRLSLVVILAVAGTWAITTRAQSQHPFGQPSASQPQPASQVKAVPGSRAQGWLSQGRSEVVARHGIVATSDPLAGQDGLDILRQGGNAIDAAVATGAMLDVTSQNDTGIGGDLRHRLGGARGKLYALGRGLGAGQLDARVLREARREADAGLGRQRRHRAGGGWPATTRCSRGLAP